MNLHSLLLRQISTWLRRHYSTSGTTQLITTHEVLTILNTSSSIEKSLESVLPFISPQIVTSILKNPPNPQLGLRFFIWASRYDRFKTWVCQRLVVDMLVNERESGGFDLYWEILREMKSIGVSISADAFRLLIQAYEKIGKPVKAVEVFELMMEEFQVMPTVFTYNAVLNVMVRSGICSLGLAVYNRMLKCNCSPNEVTFGILIDGLCKSRKVEFALEMVHEMTKSGFPPSAFIYTMVISGLCRVEKVDEAYRLFNKMKDSGISPDSATFNALLDGFCKVGRVDEAFVLLRDFEKDGHVLGVRGYNCLIHGLFHVKRHEEAQALYRKMIEEGIVPNVVLYTIMIKGLFEVGKFNDAQTLFDEMNASGVLPDTYLYNVLIKGFCDKGLLDEAKSLRLEISKHNSFPNTCTYTILICGMCRNGLVEEAEKLFKEMEELECYPSVVTFNALIDGLHKAGNLEKANHKFLEMGIGRTPSLFLRLSQGGHQIPDSGKLQKKVAEICDSGSILKDYKTLKQLADSVVPDITTYNILINRYCKERNIDFAIKVFKELQRNGISPDSVTYGTLINGLLKEGIEEPANKYGTLVNGLLRVIKDKDDHVILDQITKNGCKLDISFYNTLMKWTCTRKDVSLAFSIWLKYLRGTVNREDEAIKVIEVQFEKGDVENAVRGLLEMDIKSNEIQLAPYSICLIGLCQARRVDEALKIFFILEEYNIVVTPPSCVMLMASLCKERNLDEAIHVFCYTIDKGFMLKPRICNNLIRALLKSKHKANDALDLLELMKSKGYDLDSYLHESTKSILRGHWNSLGMEKVSSG